MRKAQESARVAANLLGAGERSQLSNLFCETGVENGFQRCEDLIEGTDFSGGDGSAVQGLKHKGLKHTISGKTPRKAPEFQRMPLNNPVRWWRKSDRITVARSYSRILHIPNTT
jgi:hypothetical protein